MIYLDNSATTKIRSEVYEAMIPYLTDEFGNPSSKYYEKSVNARNAVEEARFHVASLIGAKSEEIIFTSGATESTNMIIKGVSDYQKHYAKRGNHIITSKVEHKATLNTCKFLNGEIYSNNDATFSFSKKATKVDRGYEVDFIDANEFGEIEASTLQNAIKDTTTIASVIWGNNEIGTLSDVQALSKVCNLNNVLFHTDATQVVGKMSIDVNKVGVDFMSFSAHKLNGPKGIGAAFIKGDDYGLPPITSLLHGGEQENGVRGSTLAVHDIVGFGKACELALKEENIIKEQYKKLDENILQVLNSVEKIKLLGSKNNRLPGIYSIVVDDKDFNNERFLKKVSSEFSVSSGSACSAGMPSHVLQAIGLGDKTSKVVRISVNHNEDIQNVVKFIDVLKSYI